MLGRLGFTGRLVAIVFLAMLVLLMAGAAVSYMSARQQGASAPGLLPERAGAIVAILEHTASAAGREIVLKGVNSDTLAVSVSPERPFNVPPEDRMKAVEWLVGQYLGGATGREVIAYVEKDERPRWRQLRVANLWMASRKPMRIAVEMRPRGWAVFETRGDISPRVFGVPPGFAVGLAGALVGLVALLAIAREARPLRELSRSVSRFAGEASPQPVTPRGAPEVKALIASINDMQARIAALLKGRTILLGAISHDLKTFLTRLRFRVEAISDPEQQAKAVRDLDDMTDLIDTALAVAKGNAGSDRRERVDLAAIAAADVADRRQGSVELTAPAPVTVDGNAVALRRIVANLLDNALRYGNRARLSVLAEAGKAVLLVDDDGPGIPETDRQAVLEPFYRLEPSRSRATGGSGLGLAIVKQILEGHDGTIAIETSPMGGVRMRVSIPLATQAA